MDAGERRDKKDIIHELQKHFKVLFEDNKIRINTIREKLGGETMAYSELIKNFNKIRDYISDRYLPNRTGQV